MPVTEDQAYRARLLAEELTDVEKKREALQIASRYENETIKSGGVPYEALRRQQIAKRESVINAFTDPESYGLDAKRLEVFNQAYGNQPEEKAKYWNIEYLADRFSVNPEEVDRNYPLYRNAYAEKEFGEPVATETDFYNRVSTGILAEQNIRERAHRHAMAGIPPEDSIFRLDEPLDLKLHKYHDESYRAAQNRILPYRLLVDQSVSYLREEMGLTASEDIPGGRELVNMTEFEAIAEELLDVPDKDRDFVLSAIIEKGKLEAGDDPEKWNEQMLIESFGRGLSGLGENLERTYNRLQIEGVRNLIDGRETFPAEWLESPEAFFQGLDQTAKGNDIAASFALAPFVGEKAPITPEFREQLKTQLDRNVKRLDLQRQVSRIARGEIDPAKTESMVTNGLFMAAESVPYMVTAMLPGGLLANMYAFTEIGHEILSDRFPDMAESQKMQLAPVAGIGMGLIEKVSPQIFLGKLPTFGKLVNTAAVTPGALLTRGGIRLAEGTAVELAQENIQDLMPFFVTEVAGALSADVPDVPWREIYGDTMAAQPELFFAVLPLTLIGAGVGTYRDFTGSIALMSNSEMLEAAGYQADDALKISQLTHTGKTAEAQKLMNQAFDRIADKPTEATSAQVAKAAEKVAAQQVDIAATISRAEELGILPSTRRTQDGFSLVFKDGTVLPVGTYSELEEIRTRYLADRKLKLETGIRSALRISDTAIEAGRQINWILSPLAETAEARRERGEVAPDQEREALAERVQRDFGTPEQEYETAVVEANLSQPADVSTVILGENQTTFADGVYQTTIKVFQGATPLTVFEEKTEGDAWIMLENGKRDWLISSIRDFERMTGELVFLEDKDDATLTRNEIIEAYSDMAVAFLVGRSGKGEGRIQWEAGRFWKLASEAMNSQAGGMLGAYGAFFRSVWARASAMDIEGALTPELEAELMKSLGLAEQSVYERGVEQDATAIVEQVVDDNVPFSALRAIPGTTGADYEAFTMPDGRTLEGPASFSIMAFHGTPHKVDRFSLEKIGTGEGAQAYGWGLYFAESERVAESYRKSVRNEFVDWNALFKSSLIEAELPGVDNAVKALWQVVNNNDGKSTKDVARIAYNRSRELRGNLNNIEKAVEIARGKIEADNLRGSLYTVELDANAEDFLDWDKPLSEQSEIVKDFFKDERNATGQQLYESLDKKVSWKTGNPWKEVSEMLAKAGIKGIRYLDGNSRSDGEGSYNYVIFDENLVKILKENGEPLQDERAEMQPSFSALRVTSERDAEYLAAVESGDMEAAQRMVDEAADSRPFAVRPPKKLYRGEREGEGQGTYVLGKGRYSTPDKKTASNYGTVKKVEISDYWPRNPLVLSGVGPAPGLFSLYLKRNTEFRSIRELNKVYPDVSVFLKGLGYDGLISSDEVVRYTLDPVTYDESGNVIPLSQRFNTESDNINFSAIQYRIEHQPHPEDSQLHDLTEMFGDDIYGPNALQYYGVGQAGEKEAVSIFKKIKGKPNAPVTVYRVVPDFVEEINPGDWVTVSKEAAESMNYPEFLGMDKKGNLQTPKIISKEVKASEIRWPGDSVLEQGYFPEGFSTSFSALRIPTTGDLETRIATAFSPFLSNPEIRGKIVENALTETKRASARLQKLLPKFQTRKAINEKRKQIEDELFLEKLSEMNAIQALDVDTGDSLTPLLSQLYSVEQITDKNGRVRNIRRGKLKSLAQARKDGDNLNEYDDARNIKLPSYIYGGDMLPDQAAGMLGFDSIPEMWAALDQEAKSKADMIEAQEEVQKAITQARKDAQAEAKTQADEMAAAASKVKASRETLVEFMRLLDSLIATLPPEIRGKIGGFVKLAQIQGPEAMLAEIENRIGRMDVELERWLKKDVDERIRKLFTKAQPKAEAGKKPKGKLGAVGQEVFRRVEAAYLTLSGEGGAARAIEIENQIFENEDVLSDTEHAILEAELQLVPMVSGWNNLYGEGKTKAGKDSTRVIIAHGKTAAERAAALDTLQAFYELKRDEWLEIVTAKREDRAAKRAQAIEDAGGDKSKITADKQRVADEKRGPIFKKYGPDLLNFNQVLGLAFGEGSATQRRFGDMERDANAQASMEFIQTGEAVENLFTEIAGGRLKGKQLQFDLSRKKKGITVKSKGVERILSQMEAITVLFFAQQEQGTRHLRGRVDDDGNAVSDWHYDEAFVQSVRDQLSPEAERVMEFMRNDYAQEHVDISPIYERNFGIKLPENPNYAPLTVASRIQKDAEMKGDPGESTVVMQGLTPPSLRSRGTAIAEPKFEDALQVFLAHKREIAHWKAHVELSTELTAVLGMRETMSAVRNKAGESTEKLIGTWLKEIADGGTMQAGAHLAIAKVMNRVMNRVTLMNLVGRVGTVLIQWTQIAAPASKMPQADYHKRLFKLFANRLDMSWKQAWNSDFMMLRRAQTPVVVQHAFEGINSFRPDILTESARFAGLAINEADVLWTSASYAILYDYHLDRLRSLEYEGEQLTQEAHSQTKRDLEEIAQPTRSGTRSMLENTQRNALYKMLWAHSSEARKNIGLTLYSGMNRNPIEAGRAAWFALIVGPGLSAITRAAWRDARDEEDDEIFDETNWDAKRLTLAWATEPLYGIPFVGEEIQRLAFSVGGEYMPDGGMLSAISRSGTPIKRTAENLGNILDGDLTAEETEQILRDVDGILALGGLFTQQFASGKSLWNIVRDAFAVGRNVLE